MRCLLSFVFVAYTAVAAHTQAVSSPNGHCDLQPLLSTTWNERAGAFANLKASSECMADPNVRRALMQLLGREESVINAALLASNGSDGASAKYGEAYGEYFAQLLAAVSELVDWRNGEEVCVLARSSYNPDSPLAGKIASAGAVAIPCLADLARSDIPARRAQTVGLLIRILGTQTSLSAGAAEEIRKVSRTALHDTSPTVRSAAMDALGQYGGSEMISVLADAATSNPAVHKWPDGSITYPLRELAAKSIANIERRELARAPSPRQ